MLLALLAYLCQKREAPGELGWEGTLCHVDALVSLILRNWVILGTLPGAQRTLSVLGWGTAIRDAQYAP